MGVTARSLLKIHTNTPEPKIVAFRGFRNLGDWDVPYDAANHEKLQNQLQTAKNDAGKGRQLAGVPTPSSLRIRRLKLNAMIPQR
jgi:hypothetical protein